MTEIHFIVLIKKEKKSTLKHNMVTGHDQTDV